MQFEEVPLGEAAELLETGLCKATPLGGPGGPPCPLPSVGNAKYMLDGSEPGMTVFGIIISSHGIIVLEEGE